MNKEFSISEIVCVYTPSMLRTIYQGAGHMAFLGENPLWQWTKYSLWKSDVVLDISVDSWHLSTGKKKCRGRRASLRHWHIHCRGSLWHRGNGRGDEQTGFIQKLRKKRGKWIALSIQIQNKRSEMEGSWGWNNKPWFREEKSLTTWERKSMRKSSIVQICTFLILPNRD